MFRLFKSLGLLTLLTGGLAIFGHLVEILIPWYWLTSFFQIVRFFGNMFSFTWDVDTLWLIVGLSLSLEALLWGFRAYLYVVKFLR